MTFEFKRTKECPVCKKKHTGKSKLDYISADIGASNKVKDCQDSHRRKGGETFTEVKQCPTCKKKHTGQGKSPKYAKQDATNKANKCARSHVK